MTTHYLLPITHTVHREYSSICPEQKTIAKKLSSGILSRGFFYEAGLHKSLFHKNHDTMADKNLLQYEMMVMYKPDLTQKATKEALQTTRDFIAEAGGKINHEDIWEKRDMAYLIKGYGEAYYVVFYFTMGADKLAELKADLDLEQTILRKMVIKFPTSLTLDGYLEESKRTLAEEEVLEAARMEKVAEKAARDAERSPRKRIEPKTEKAEGEADAKVAA